MHTLLKRQNYIQSTREANIVNCIAKGINRFNDIAIKLNLNETVLEKELAILEAQNLIRQNQYGQYEWERPILDEFIVLDGEALMPPIFLYLEDRLVVSRGREWFTFPVTTDKRRIMWNIDFADLGYKPENGEIKTDLISLISNSTVKTKSTKNKQLKEYENLVDKLVPYEIELKLHLKVIGENYTDIDIIPILTFEINEIGMLVEYRKFKIRSKIDTNELVESLMAPQGLRNYKSIISLDKIIKFDDILFNGNCIPTKYMYNDDNVIVGIEFIEVKLSKGEYYLTLKEFTSEGEFTISDVNLTKELLIENLQNKKDFELLHNLMKQYEFTFEI